MVFAVGFFATFAGFSSSDELSLLDDELLGAAFFFCWALEVAFATAFFAGASSSDEELSLLDEELDDESFLFGVCFVLGLTFLTAGDFLGGGSTSMSLSSEESSLDDDTLAAAFLADVTFFFVAATLEGFSSSSDELSLQTNRGNDCKVEYKSCTGKSRNFLNSSLLE